MLVAEGRIELRNFGVFEIKLAARPSKSSQSEDR